MTNSAAEPAPAADSTAACPGCEARTGRPLACYNPRGYGEQCAEFYDQIYAPPSSHQLRALVSLAGGRPVLELGVGTGRVACALAVRGLEVWGIDSSPRMLAQLALRDPAGAVHAIEADIADFALKRRFGLILLLVDTLALLPTAAAQAALRRAAAHLLPGGLLLVESFRAARESASAACNAGVRLHTSLGERLYAPVLHARSEAEREQMARRAGLQRHARWSNWDPTPWHPAAEHFIDLFHAASD